MAHLPYDDLTNDVLDDIDNHAESKLNVKTLLVIAVGVICSIVIMKVIKLNQEKKDYETRNV